MASFNEYPNYDALGLAELVRRRELSASDLVEAALNAIETLNPRLNAVVRILAESARAAAAGALAEGPFRGVPMLLKDTGVFLAGVPTKFGSRFFKGFTRD